MKNITKELLSDVLGENVDNIRMSDIPANRVVYEVQGAGIRNPYVINIYELAHKCKEWAINYGKGYYVWTGINHNSKWDVFVTKFNSFSKFEPVEYQAVYNPLGGKETEPEAVFKACEWILENK